MINPNIVVMRTGCQHFPTGRVTKYLTPFHRFFEYSDHLFEVVELPDGDLTKVVRTSNVVELLAVGYSTRLLISRINTHTSSC